MRDFIKYTFTPEEKVIIRDNILNAKKFALKYNIRLTKSKITKKVFLDFLKDEDFIKKLIDK